MRRIKRSLLLGLVALCATGTVLSARWNMGGSATRHTAIQGTGNQETWTPAPTLKQGTSGGQVYWNGYLWGAWDSYHGVTAFNGTKTVRAGKTCAGYVSGAPTLYATGSGLFACLHAPQAIATFSTLTKPYKLGEQVTQVGSKAVGTIYRSSGNVISIEVYSGTFDKVNPIQGVTSGAVAKIISVTNNSSVNFIEWSRDGWSNFVPVTDIAGLGVPYLPRQLCDCGIIKGPIGEYRNVRVLIYGEYTEGNPTLYYCLPDINIRKWVPLFTCSGTGTGAWPQSTQAVRHYHGEIFVPGLGAKEGRLFVITGDSNEQSSILYCDDVADLCNHGSKWMTNWGLNLSGPTRVNFLKTGAGVPYCLCAGLQDCRSVDIVVDSLKKYAYYVPDQSGKTVGNPDGANFLRKVDLKTMRVTTVGERVIGQGWTGCLAPDGTVLISTESDYGEQGVRAYNGNCDAYAHLYALGDDLASLYEIAQFRRADFRSPVYPSYIALNKISVCFGAVWGWDQMHDFDIGDPVGLVAKSNRNPLLSFRYNRSQPRISRK